MNLPREAERPFRYAVEKWLEDLDPHRGLIDAHRGLFVIYYDQGAITPALYHLRELTRLEPADGRPWRTMGYIAKNILEQNPTAAEHYQEALRRDLSPRAAEETHMELGEVLVKQGKYQEALKHLEQVRAIPKVLALRAECLWSLGKPTDAKDVLAQALAAAPTESDALDALRLRARIYLDESHDEPVEGRASRYLQEAAGLLERALRIDPHDHASRNLLTQAYGKMGRPDDAAEQRRLLAQTHEYLDELAKLNQIAMEHPWDADVRQRLEQVCIKLNLRQMAEMWRRAAHTSAGASSSKNLSPPGQD
jgi:tetratricopeptide (TPR) repeat protein